MQGPHLIACLMDPNIQHSDIQWVLKKYML